MVRAGATRGCEVAMGGADARSNLLCTVLSTSGGNFE